MLGRLLQQPFVLNLRFQRGTACCLQGGWWQRPCVVSVSEEPLAALALKFFSTFGCQSSAAQDVADTNYDETVSTRTGSDLRDEVERRRERALYSQHLYADYDYWFAFDGGSPDKEDLIRVCVRAFNSTSGVQ